MDKSSSDSEQEALYREKARRQVRSATVASEKLKKKGEANRRGQATYQKRGMDARELVPQLTWQLLEKDRRIAFLEDLLRRGGNSGAIPNGYAHHETWLQQSPSSQLSTHTSAQQHLCVHQSPQPPIHRVLSDVTIGTSSHWAPPAPSHPNGYCAEWTMNGGETNRKASLDANVQQQQQRNGRPMKRLNRDTSNNEGANPNPSAPPKGDLMNGGEARQTHHFQTQQMQRQQHSPFAENNGIGTQMSVDHEQHQRRQYQCRSLSVQSFEGATLQRQQPQQWQANGYGANTLNNCAASPDAYQPNMTLLAPNLVFADSSYTGSQIDLPSLLQYRSQSVHSFDASFGTNSYYGHSHHSLDQQSQQHWKMGECIGGDYSATAPDNNHHHHCSSPDAYQTNMMNGDHCWSSKRRRSTSSLSQMCVGYQTMHIFEASNGDSHEQFEEQLHAPPFAFEDAQVDPSGPPPPVTRTQLARQGMIDELTPINEETPRPY